MNFTRIVGRFEDQKPTGGEPRIIKVQPKFQFSSNIVPNQDIESTNTKELWPHLTYGGTFKKQSFFNEKVILIYFKILN